MKRGMTPRGVKAWKEFERVTARMLRKLDPRARRCLQYQREHGMPDVVAGVLWVECKSGRQQRPVPRVYQEAAQKARVRKGAVPAVVSRGRDSRGTKLVTLSLADFVRIAGAHDWARRQLWKGGQP